ncbi:MAG TPA: MMPL family transporter, partial [Acidimicrobiia bacterium]
ELSGDGTVAVAPVTTSNASNAHPTKIAKHIQDLAAPLRAEGVDVQFAGGWFASGSVPASETVGVLAAIVILLVAFGSMIAMGLPILTALVGIAISLCGVGILTHVVTTPSFVPQVAAMIGIGVGIDYALFIVTRYRDALHRSGSPELAVIEAMTTSGRAVVFAGVTVMISVLGMFLIGLSFLYGLAAGTSVAVAIAVLAATTLLPAMLGFVGFTIDRLHVGPRRRVAHETMWHRWARTVQHNPAVIAAAGLVVLVLAGVPTFAMRLGSADAHNDPKSSTTYKAYELISHGFGPGANGPILVVMDETHPGSTAAVPRVLHALQTTPGVASVGTVRDDERGTASIATLTATTDPQDKATERLVHHIRDEVVPEATAGSGLVVRIGGQTAAAIDFTDTMSNRMPLFIGGVLGLSFLLLLVVFRSVLVPLKAVLMNLLSIGAAYGVIVAIFEWGWGAGIIGVQKGPIDAWVPMMLFAIVFGMSMDYEVFLLSSIKEQYDRTGDNATAVAEGLSNTARVITAAALIMVFVFG